MAQGESVAADSLSPGNVAAAPLTPSRPEFRPRRWLRGGHLQTIASFLLPRRIRLDNPEERLIEVAPGVKVRCWCHWISDRPEERRAALTIIVLHGLEGSTDSQYMLGVTRDGLAAGMNVIRMNQRNCGGMDDNAPTLYNSSLSADIAAVARYFLGREEIGNFALAGFSMGGNLMLKLAGEWGSAGPPQFRAVAAVCPAIDLAESADALHDPGNRIYEYYFMWQLFRRLRLKAKLFPETFDVGRLRGISTIRQFDDRITAYYCGFTSADDYYYRAAAARVIDRIAVPALVIHAADDPFIRLRADTRQKIAANPNITFIETKHGGHCAFVGERNGKDGDDGRWAEREIVEFIGRCRVSR